MKILSIYPGHCATVAYMKDGEVVDCISEEKFDNVKNSISFPIKSIEWILKKNSLDINEFDKIAIVGKSTVFYDINISSGSVTISLPKKDGFIKKIYKFVDYKIQSSKKDEIIKRIQLYRYNKNFEDRKSYYFSKLSQILGIKDLSKIELVDHHDSHAYCLLWS